MSKILRGNLEEETPVLKIDNGNKKQERGLLSFFLLPLFALFLCGTVCAQTSPTQINDVHGLNDMSANGSYIITGDINASGYTTKTSFTGTLTAQAKSDGTFPVISGLTQPLFGTATDATISNIMLKNVEIDQSGRVGAIAGTANGTTRIYNCGILPTTTVYNDKGNIVGFGGSQLGSTDNYCGGLVGYLDGYARVINCFSYANIFRGTTVAGIVGYNTTATMQGNEAYFNSNVKTMVMNCMFYANITGGDTKYPVYGGEKFYNNAADKVNNYNYFFEAAATFIDENTSFDDYNYSWQVSEKYLTRFEFYRSILNSNRRLCAWWVNGTYLKDQPCQTDAQVEAVGIAKWVVDQTVSPFPILKKWGKYPSIVNPNSSKVYNPKTNSYIDRSSANEWEGKSFGTLAVTIKGGSGNSSATASRNLVITDMDTLNFDYCPKKIQLPYYNEIFGNPNGTTWAAKYGNNYHNKKVVTGWKITAVTGGTPGSFVEDWQNGYNFADRNCTNKDLYSVSGRVFAQGGYYYVPEGVSAITIEAYWGDAVYLCNANRCLDRVKNGAEDFYVSGQLPDKVGGENNQTVKTTLSDAVDALTVQPTKTVYDQAIVLVGNYQNDCFQSAIKLNGSQYDSYAKPFTIMSADFDFDNEPDNCFEVGMYNGKRENVQPIRFDFLPVPDITMAIRHSQDYYGMRIFCPQGHFEITETSFMYTTQFEYDRRNNSGNDYKPYQKREAPVILNGGEFFQIVSAETGNQSQSASQAMTTWGADKTSYFIMGGHFWMKAFTPGVHGNNIQSTRHCAVSVMGGEFSQFYLSGMFRADFYNKTDNPHCYTNGGKFGLIAGAGMESVGAQNEANGGNVTFQIDRSLIQEFYGGGINGQRPVAGNIHVTCNNSIVHKYCGGPKLGDMTLEYNPNRTITNIANNTIFGNFYGGGNGGTNMLRERQYDSGTEHDAPNNEFWNTTGKFDAFTPFSYNANKGYQAEYEFELLPQPSGKSKVVIRSYYHWATFSRTNVAPATSTLTDCIVRHDFYGGGYLGSVNGNVTSTLQGNTVVYGSVYGGGFSASIPSFAVHDKSTVHYAYSDNSGYIHDGWLDYRKYTSDMNLGTHHVGDTIYYQWIDQAHIPSSWGVSPSTSNPKFEDPSVPGKWYCFTKESLDNLGAISGNTILTIKGNTTVYNNVFGGGNESAVFGNTEVLVKDKTRVLGNIYGGGNMGAVEGKTKVIVNGQSSN